VLFRNFGDAKTNTRLTTQLELKDRYKKCQKDLLPLKHGYCVINSSPFVSNEALRVSFNIFGEFKELGPFPLFYSDEV
jgi:hypothetical protein